MRKKEGKKPKFKDFQRVRFCPVYSNRIAVTTGESGELRGVPDDLYSRMPYFRLAHYFAVFPKITSPLFTLRAFYFLNFSIESASIWQYRFKPILFTDPDCSLPKMLPAPRISISRKA